MGGTAAGDRVSTSRKSRVWSKRLPAIVIYTLTNRAEEFESAPKSYRRTLRLACELWVSKPSPEPDVPDDELDALSREVEALILPAIPAIIAAVDDGDLSHSGYEGFEADFDEEGRKPIGGGRCTFVFAYIETPDYLPADGLAPFDRIHIEHDLAPADGTPEAVDDIALDAG